MHIIGQKQYAEMTPEQTREYLVKQLDLLQQAHCNAVIWQIRPRGHAGSPASRAGRLNPCGTPCGSW